MSESNSAYENTTSFNIIHSPATIEDQIINQINNFRFKSQQTIQRIKNVRESVKSIIQIIENRDKELKVINFPELGKRLEYKEEKSMEGLKKYVEVGINAYSFLLRVLNP